jgi:hypothetical protein
MGLDLTNDQRDFLKKTTKYLISAFPELSVKELFRECVRVFVECRKLNVYYNPLMQIELGVKVKPGKIPKIGDAVCLDDWDKFLITTVAGFRQAINTRNGEVSKFDVSYEKDLWFHVVGYTGEIAVAKMLNCYPDLGLVLHKAWLQEDNGDAVFNGKNIDVKHKLKRCPDLEVNVNKKNNPIDLFLLTKSAWIPHNLKPLPNLVEFKGAATYEEVMNSPINDKGTMHILPQNELHELSNLL